MFQKTADIKDSFLEQTKSARKERALEKQRELAAVVIQAHVRGWLSRNRTHCVILADFDNVLRDIKDDGSKPAQITSLQLYQQARKLLLVWKKDRDKNKFLKLCRYLLISLESDSPKYSYIGVALNKQYVIKWIAVTNDILWKCCGYLKDSKGENPIESAEVTLFLHLLVAFTSTNTWNLLRNKNMEPLRPGMIRLSANLMGQLLHKGFYIVLKDLLKSLNLTKKALRNISVNAIMTLSLRPIISTNFSEKFMTMFLIHILSVPALIYHLENLAPECISTMNNHKMFARTLDLLSSQQSIRIIFNALEGNYALCLLANLLEMAYIERDNCLQEIYYPSFVIIVTTFLESCQSYVVSKQSNLTHWHPVLGWFAQPMDSTLYEGMIYVKKQLQLLWHPQLIYLMLGSHLIRLVENCTPPQMENAQRNFGGNFLKKVFDTKDIQVTSQAFYKTLGSPEVHRIILTCSMYFTALTTLTQLQLDIFTGLCYHNGLLYNMWLFLCSLGPNCGMKMFFDHLAMNTKSTAPEFQMLQLFCTCMTHYVTILDDVEMYEQQLLFNLNDFVVLSNFLNLFLYKAITSNLFDLKMLGSNAFFQSLHTLLMLLYRRDCRRNYTSANHWLIKEIKVGNFLSELDKGRKAPQVLLQTMPHIIPHEDRVRLFRRAIMNEKSVLGLTESACACPQPTVITVHRTRIVEDGLRQLMPLTPHLLKGVIRVRFINEQGLDEAGVDQDGVFKEFLEETMKRVIDPSLNLFKTSSEERLYPSPLSYLHNNHLDLFEFIGKMLAKAVYEGIVIDVPLASFFLSQVSGQTSQALYSYVDELPSLDPELYRSLTYVKHYQGDVSELDLTFSLDEDKLGKIETHELIPGGKAIPVTNENKINYIHLMAHFRMHVQIRHQTAAFIKGFRCLISNEWLAHFSTPELQRLISGDNVPLDLKDLRKNTQYYGGFHDSHRVISWLWEILEKDFSEEERAMFLKFVTSCSKPPLLGFAYLQPPFSIRCVEVGDDEDTGDTIGSVIRGFFTIRKKDPQNRLPTSSTCFNLLKLPNYQKRNTLREKLRYAVTCRTGFELS